MKKILIIVMVVFMVMTIDVHASEEVLSSNINSINSTRYENFLVYFDYKTNGSKTPANQWGYEVAFNSDGVAVEANTNVTIPVGGFALSGHGTKKTLLMNVKIGDIADVNLNLMSVKITRDTLSANKFMARIRLNEARHARTTAYDFGIRYDEVAVDNLIREIENKVDAINSANVEVSNNLIKEINTNADKVIYMTSPTKSIEARAVWHRPFGTQISESSLNGIIRLINKFKEIGINTIYLETFWNGYSSYKSDILETHPKIGVIYYGEEYGYDYVKAFIGEANKVGIDVHAWLHTFSAGSPQYKSKVVKDEWLVENYQGEKLHPNVYGGSFYYDPSNDEVLDFIESVIVEIASKYNFSGIQYDYIRYYDNNFHLNQTPIQDSGYGPNAEEKFKLAYNLTGDVRTLIKNLEYRNLWNEWRMTNITNAVSRYSKKIHSINPDLMISAAVVSDLSNARNIYMQDWYTWVKRGYIDVLAPMIYTGSSSAVKNSSIDILEKLSNKTYLVSGIAPVYYGYSTMINHEQVLATDLASGNALFASQNVVGLSDVEESLNIGRYRYNAANISASGKEIINFFLNNFKANINDVYLPRNLMTDETSNILMDEIDNILLMEKNNPKDLNLVLSKINVLSNLSLYISNENLRGVVKAQIDSLYHTVDIKISRYLINNDYWDPTINSTRPDPDLFDYPVIDNGNEEEQEIDEQVKEIEQKSNLKYWFLASIAVLILGIKGFILYRKKVKR